MRNKIRYMLGTLAVSMLLSALSFGQEVTKDESLTPTDGEIVFYKSKKTPEQIRADFSKLKFEIELGKTDYLLLEPVVLKCKFSNPTDETLDINKPEIRNQLGLRTIFDGESEVTRDLFGINVNVAPVIQPLAPGEVIEELVLFQPGDGLFKRLGEYQVQFFLTNMDGNISSNTISITVNKPEGENEQAYNFLRKHPGMHYDLFYMKDTDDKTRQQTLETFISKFGNSTYRDYAILGLSNLYKMTKQPEKAKAELLKIKDSQIQLLSKVVENRLRALDTSSK